MTRFRVDINPLDRAKECKWIFKGPSTEFNFPVQITEKEHQIDLLAKCAMPPFESEDLDRLGEKLCRKAKKLIEKKIKKTSDANKLKDYLTEQIFFKKNDPSVQLRFTVMSPKKRLFEQVIQILKR